MIVAIVPAAGRSERMGRPKLLLPLGARPVVEHVLRALGAARVDRTIAVLPPGADALLSIVRAAGADAVVLPEPTPDMRASVVQGLDHAERLSGPRPPAAFLVAPADHPAVSAAVVNRLIDAFRRGSSNVSPAEHTKAGTARRPSIFIPTYAGRRGHPVLFAWQHADGIRALAADRGINSLVAALADEIAECPVDDSGVLVDLDTPEDYEAVQG